MWTTSTALTFPPLPATEILAHQLSNWGGGGRCRAASTCSGTLPKVGASMLANFATSIGQPLSSGHTGPHLPFIIIYRLTKQQLLRICVTVSFCDSYNIPPPLSSMYPHNIITFGLMSRLTALPHSCVHCHPMALVVQQKAAPALLPDCRYLRQTPCGWVGGSRPR